MKSKALVIALALTGGMLISTSLSANEAQIKYRQSVMKANAGHIGAMFGILKGKAASAEHFAMHASALADLAKMTRNIFPKSSSKAGGETKALDAIWEKPDEFEKVLTVFETEAAKLAEVAKTGDMAAAGAQLGALGKGACGGCHKSFREKTK